MRWVERRMDRCWERVGEATLGTYRIMLLPVALLERVELAEGSLLSIGAEADVPGLPVRTPDGMAALLGAPR